MSNEKPVRLDEVRRIAKELNGENYCPLCGTVAEFEAFGLTPRPKARCPTCWALERHRMLWLFFANETDLFDDTKKSVLHVAPETCLNRRLSTIESIEYISADLHNPQAMVQMDITDIDQEDDSYDAIVCNHVLEHIPDDRRAMRELLRVLKPGGWAVLMVPIDANRAETFEDPSVTDPQERLRLFGQDDHVRVYGRDYTERLRGAGFDVQARHYAVEVGEEILTACNLLAHEAIHYCLKR